MTYLIFHFGNDLQDRVDALSCFFVRDLEGEKVRIANVLIKKGFDNRYAYETLCKIVGNKAIKTTEGQQIRYNYEVPEIGLKGNLLHTGDREIKVLSRNKKPFVLHLVKC
ncbi:hypothetical protein [Sporosarcina globispora]|uniref:hypothetical protein n=1 Tax=Sporosarcina globispora TaxID=1459 RepID=UPI000AABF553|nr:hypothetical protein [Sporosarcina globispora]